MSLNIYNPTTQQLTEVAGLDVKDSLEKVATLPTPTADYLNQVYILVGTQEGYHVGSIYQCRYINSAYTWVEITGSVVGKADKAPNATNNHLAKLTADGNLADSGIAVGDLGTAINKNWTDLVRPNSHDLVESNAVYSAITNAISSIYTPHGDITCAELVPALLIDENIGNVYTVTDSGTTTAYFMQGAGKTINTGDSVSIIKAGETTILFNLMGNVLDLTDYQKKNLTTPLTIGDTTQTTVEGALGALNTTKATQAEVKGNWSEGGKNLIPFPYTDGFSKTMNGITYVVNSDGSVTANGTATDTSHFSLCQPQLDLEDGTYILTGDMDEETSYNKTCILFNENSGSGASHWNYGKNAPCEFTQNGWKVSELRIRITSGATVNNQTFYPMIRLASDTDDTYVPYAMTNQEITKGFNDKVGSYTDDVSHKINQMVYNTEFKGMLFHDEISNVWRHPYDIVPLTQADFALTNISSKVNIREWLATKCGRVVTLSIVYDITTTTFADGEAMFTLGNYVPSGAPCRAIAINGTHVLDGLSLNLDGSLRAWGTLTQGAFYTVTFTYIV